MSWNIRTWGTHVLRADDVRRIAVIILEQQVDIICVQELQCGEGTAMELGADISETSLDAVAALLEVLDELDPGSLWWSGVSGVNNDKSGSMRDAYVFLWKTYPAKSKFAHGDPVDGLEDISEPIILDSKKFFGRRPGLFAMNVHTGSNITPINIVSYHAVTPCNSFGKGGKGSGHSINALSTLTEIGGGMMTSTGFQFVYKEVNPLPQVDTIVLGDFNYSMDTSNAELVYKSLLTYYEPCINGPGFKEIRNTTYSADPTIPFKQSSAYDNIFVLKEHKGFKPALTFNKQSMVTDFIKSEAEKLGKAAEIKYFATETGWYIVYKDTYRNQYGTIGISDHLPVWAEFDISGGSASSTARRILPTSGTSNNCLLHAVFGNTNNSTLFTDANDATNRKALADWIKNLQTVGNFPNQRVRAAILMSMINEFWDNTPLVNKLQQLLDDTSLNPFLSAEFIFVFNQYIDAMREGRMLYVHEAEVLAYANNMTIALYWLDQGKYSQNILNPGQANSVNVYHQGLHFCRFNPV